jgi:hypothetical protein
LQSKNADDWYEEVKKGEPLFQGQVLPNFRIRQATYRFVGEAPEVETRPSAHAIILTQTCDLYRPEKDEGGSIIHNVLVAPVVPMGIPHIKKAPEYAAFKITQYHWLAASDTFGIPYSVVPFALVTSIPFEVIQSHANAQRCFRLKSPFLEHLAHRFGTIFARVALPEPAYDPAAYAKKVEELRAERTQKEKEAKARS